MNIKNKFNEEVLTYYNKQSSYLREKPKSIEPIDEYLELQNQCKRPVDWDNGCNFNMDQHEYVATLNNASVGTEGAIFDDENVYVLNNSYPSSTNTNGLQLYDEMVTIVQKWGYGYYHWLGECFPRLLQFLEDTGKRNVYVLTWDTPFVRQYLNMIGIKDSQIVPFKNGIQYKVKKLYVPTPIYCGNPHKDMLNRLNKWFNQFYKPEMSKVNILISREGQAKRQLKDFNLLFDRLKNEFPENEWIIFDSMPIMETIELFSRANMVVGVNGAGLTNVVFTPSDCKIIDICPVGDCTINMCDWHMISSIERPYRMVPVKFGNPAPVISVDFDKVVKTVKDF